MTTERPWWAPGWWARAWSAPASWAPAWSAPASWAPAGAAPASWAPAVGAGVVGVGDCCGWPDLDPCGVAAAPATSALPPLAPAMCVTATGLCWGSRLGVALWLADGGATNGGCAAAGLGNVASVQLMNPTDATPVSTSAPRTGRQPFSGGAGPPRTAAGDLAGLAAGGGAEALTGDRRCGSKRRAGHRASHHGASHHGTSQRTPAATGPAAQRQPAKPPRATDYRAATTGPTTGGKPARYRRPARRARGRVAADRLGSDKITGTQPAWRRPRRTRGGPRDPGG